MTMITTDDIQISVALGVDKLLEFSLSAKMNEHGRLKYSGLIGESRGTSVVEKMNRTDPVTVLIKDEPVFVGQPLSISLVERNRAFTLTVECSSTSYLADVEEQSRSFQYPQMTYAEIVRTAFSVQKDRSALIRQGENVVINKPIIQYKETDWAFTLRLASHLETVVLPNIRSVTPQIAFGVPRGKNYQVETEKYKIGRFRKRCNDGAWREFLYYIIEDDRWFELGDKIEFLGAVWLVAGKKSVLLDSSLLRNTYLLANEQAYGLRRFWNSKLHGVSLLGTVIDTKDEDVRLHLDIDEKQEKERAYWYPFTPLQGNVMYSLPQHGTKARLKIHSRDEGDSAVEHCYRTNGEECADTSDYHNRYYTTEFGKRMAMLPDLFYLWGGSNKVSLQDQSGISAATGKETRMYADGFIRFHSRGKISFITPEQMIMAKTSQESGIEVSGGELHTRSKYVYLQGGTDPTGFNSENMAPLGVELPLDLALRFAALTPIVMNSKTLLE